MAELHPNQIPFEAPEPVMANFAAPKDYISGHLIDMANTIEDAVEFNMKLDDIKLAAKVKANMAEGIQNIKTGDAVGGDYTTLKNDALALYQVSFEGATPSAVKRYMREHPTELQEYELQVEAVTAEKENKAADVRIQKEMSNITSRVALGQMSWTDAVKMLHVLGGDKITSDQYESYTHTMRSDIDKYQLAMYLSGDMQSNMIAVEKLNNPDEWTTLTALERAQAKHQAQSNINQMLKDLASEKEKKTNEPYATIERSLLNSAYTWRDLGDGDQLTQLKQKVENLALTGSMDLFDTKGNKIATINYNDIQPQEWGKIRDELDKVQLHSIKQQQHDADFTVTALKLESNLDQGYANQTLSNSEQLAVLTKDPRAADILKDNKLVELKLKASEFTDRTANALRPTQDIDTPVAYSRAFWGLIRTADQSPWSKANTFMSNVDTLKKTIENDDFQRILSDIRIAFSSAGAPDNIEASSISDVGRRLLDTDANSELGKKLEASPMAVLARDAFKRAKNNFALDPEDVAAIMTNNYANSNAWSQVYNGQETARTILNRLKETVFNGTYAPLLVENTRLEYVALMAGLMASKRDIAKFGEALGLPKGLALDPDIIAEALRTVGSKLEREGTMNQIVTDDTRNADSELFLKALGLDRIARTEEQKQAWDSLVFATYWCQSHANGSVARYLDSDSPRTLAEPENQYSNTVNTLKWTGRK